MHPIHVVSSTRDVVCSLYITQCSREQYTDSILHCSKMRLCSNEHHKMDRGFCGKFFCSKNWHSWFI